jgi:hypothetical protein
MSFETDYINDLRIQHREDEENESKRLKEEESKREQKEAEQNYDPTLDSDTFYR